MVGLWLFQHCSWWFDDPVTGDRLLTAVVVGAVEGCVAPAGVLAAPLSARFFPRFPWLVGFLPVAGFPPAGLVVGPVR